MRKQLNVLKIQHTDPRVDEIVIMRFKQGLLSYQHRVLRHHRLPRSYHTFMLYFGNKETLENAIKDDRVIALLQSLGFKPIEDAQATCPQMHAQCMSLVLTPNTILSL